jgi:hypothetical protein
MVPISLSYITPLLNLAVESRSQVALAGATLEANLLQVRQNQFERQL